MTSLQPISFTAHSATEQKLAPDLQRAVQVLCDTYEAIDLRIETTLGKAEADFLAALPEVKNYEDELRQLVGLLMADVRKTLHGEAISTEPLLLRFTYQDQQDLVEQLISTTQAHVVVVPVDDNVSFDAIQKEAFR